MNQAGGGGAPWGAAAVGLRTHRPGLEPVRGRLRRALGLAALGWVGLAGAASPADEHRRALAAYHRGDVVAAIRGLRAPADAGHAPSQALLGFLLEQADETTAAARWYEAAARQGDAEGHHGLAGLLLVGRGVAKDEKAALQHFSKAASLGHRSAIDTVAMLWIKGQAGADAQAEPAMALAAVRRAADGGHLPSADALAEAYRSGRFGLGRDEAQALAWQQRAQQWRRERAAASAPKSKS